MYYQKLIGQKYGRWTVIGIAQCAKNGQKSRMLCKCDCGTVKTIDSYSLTHNGTFSCGKCRTIISEGDHKRYIMKNGASFIFDNDDEALISKHTWSFSGEYPRTTINGKSVILNLVLFPGANGEIDHINGDKTDYRRANLRIATHSQNNQNKGLRRDSTTGYKGVCFDKRSKRFIAYINANKKRTYLGYFDDKEKAAKAYDEAALRLHGEFARLNFA